jgi:hypothetical protein
LKENIYNIELLPEIMQVPGMTSMNERKFLYQYGLKNYCGFGEIADLGCWIGATTISLASGISRNEKFQPKNKKIYAYDLFIWDQSYNEHIKGSNLENKFAVGDDYQNEFLKNIELYNKIVEPKRDIVKTGWNGNPIEFLLIDAMKTTDVTRKILDDFYPVLIPGKSLVYHQDFDHYLTPWVHILIYLHKPFFKHIHDVPGSGGTVFKVMERIPMSILDVDFMNLDEDLVDKAFSYSLKIASKSKHNGIAAAHVMYYVYQLKTEKAFKLWTEYLWKAYELTTDFLEVKKLIDKSNLGK